MPSTRVSEPPPEKKVDLEQALAQMLTSHTAFMNETKANMQQQATQLNNQAAQLRNLEVQMGQMANLLTERQPGSLPSNSEVNPRRDGSEHVMPRFPVRPDWRIRTCFGVRNHILGLFTCFFFFRAELISVGIQIIFVITKNHLHIQKNYHRSGVH